MWLGLEVTALGVDEGSINSAGVEGNPSFRVRSMTLGRLRYIFVISLLLEQPSVDKMYGIEFM